MVAVLILIASADPKAFLGGIQTDMAKERALCGGMPGTEYRCLFALFQLSYPRPSLIAFHRILLHTLNVVEHPETGVRSKHSPKRDHEPVSPMRLPQHPRTTLANGLSRHHSMFGLGLRMPPQFYVG